MKDLLIEVGEEMERRYGMDIFFWMDWVRNGGKLPNDLETKLEGLR